MFPIVRLFVDVEEARREAPKGGFLVEHRDPGHR